MKEKIVFACEESCISPAEGTGEGSSALPQIVLQIYLCLKLRA